MAIIITALRANPVAMPSLVMTAENVLVGVTAEGVHVTGTYRFHVSPDRIPDSTHDWFPVSAWFRIPIPVRAGEIIGPGLMSVINPELIFQGVKIKPDPSYAKFTSLPIVEGVDFMVVEFYVGRINVPEIEVVINYTQPLIHRDGKMWAHYMPLLEGFETYQKALGLRSSSYAVSFECYQGRAVVLRSSNEKILQSSSKLISVEARHREVIEVELMLN